MTLSTTTFPSQPAFDYASYLRPRIRSGDILLCAGHGVFSHLIQQATGSIWSHVGLVWHWPGLDQLVVFESIESVGVRMVPLEKYLRNYNNDGQPYPGSMVVLGHTRHPKGLPLELEEPIVRYALEQLGYAYNKQEVLRLAARIAAARLTGAELQAKGLVPQREFICSEYVSLCLAQAELGMPLNQFGFVAPADFALSKTLILRGVLSPRVQSH